jgi:hypothetical protein
MERIEFESRVTKLHADMVNDFGMQLQQAESDPGALIEGMKPRIKRDTNIHGTVFIDEAWSLDSAKSDQPDFKEEARKVTSGQMKVKDSKYRSEILILTAESRHGFFRMWMHPITREDGFAELGEVTVLDERKNTGGRLMGIFD